MAMRLEAEIARAFAVPLVTVKRYVKLYRERGAAAFFCASQKALGQQIDCTSLPTGPKVIGPGAGGAGSRSAAGDFVQYLAQGRSARVVCGLEKKDLSIDG